MGGMGIFTQGKLKHCAVGAGDKAELGRWRGHTTETKKASTSALLMHTNPALTKPGNCPCSVSTRSASRASMMTPTLWTHSCATSKQELAQWINMGDQMVVGRDTNEHVPHNSVTSLFKKFNMCNSIFDMHNHTNAPETCMDSADDRVIDGIWGTPGIVGDTQNQAMQQQTISPMDQCLMSKHFGHDPALPHLPDAQRLKLHDSKVIKRCLNHCKQAVAKLQLHHSQLTLEAIAMSQKASQARGCVVTSEKLISPHCVFGICVLL